MRGLLLAAITLASTPVAADEFVYEGDEVDLIAPITITHSVDEMREGDEVVQRYNFLVYEFESKEGFIRARTYLDENYRVSVFGPFTDSTSAAQAKAPVLEAKVMAYLKRRFAQIDRFDLNLGYKQVWPEPKARRMLDDESASEIEKACDLPQGALLGKESVDDSSQSLRCVLEEAAIRNISIGFITNPTSDD